jgi:antagonist of KipI
MVQVIKKGVFTTLQTLPVSGWRSYGVSPRGPMDIFAHTTVNKLLGNGPDALVMELHFPAAKLQFAQHCRFVLGGGDFGAVLNEQPIPLWKMQEAMPGDLLRFTALKKGFRTYLGIQGGFDAPVSRYENYLLRDDEVLAIGSAATDSQMILSEGDIASIYSPADQLACMAGPEYHWLTDEGKALLETATFSLSPAGNRMGLPLQGPALQRIQEGELLSGAVAMGTVQLLPNGQCMALMADHNTTGGYPRVITILTGELPKLAQLQPGQPFTFQMLGAEAAAQQYLRFAQQLNMQPWR